MDGHKSGSKSSQMQHIRGYEYVWHLKYFFGLWPTEKLVLLLSVAACTFSPGPFKSVDFRASVVCPLYPLYPLSALRFSESKLRISISGCFSKRSRTCQIEVVNTENSLPFIEDAWWTGALYIKSVIVLSQHQLEANTRLFLVSSVCWSRQLPRSEVNFLQTPKQGPPGSPEYLTGADSSDSSDKSVKWESMKFLMYLLMLPAEAKAEVTIIVYIE